MNDRIPIATPATLWLQTAVAMFEWYDAVVRFAFGIGRSDGHRNGHGDARGMIVASTSQLEEPTSKPEEAAPWSSSEPDSVSRPSVEVSRPLVQLRPKHRKTTARGKHRSRSKMSGSTRRRRAA